MTQKQTDDLLLKKVHYAKFSTHEDTIHSEELFISRNHIPSKDVWVQADKIPYMAGTYSESEDEDVTALRNGENLETYTVSGDLIVTKLANVCYNYIEGTQFTFEPDREIEPTCENLIPDTYGLGYYPKIIAEISANTYIDISFHSGEWLYDYPTGLLRFFGNLPPKVNTSSNIFVTVYKYSGHTLLTSNIAGGQGTIGATGYQGSTGPQGFQGIPGTASEKGDQGFQGVQGVQGFTGSQGIPGTASEKGDIGPTGFQGATGFQGFQVAGVQGSQGATRFQGVQGIKGEKGNIGIQGLQGDQGVQGSTGVQGLQGNQGFQGSIGPTGVQGTQGSTGVQGVQGNIGTTGLQGVQGIDGEQGPQGNQGPCCGITGPTGPTNSSPEYPEPQRNSIAVTSGDSYANQFDFGDNRTGIFDITVTFPPEAPTTGYNGTDIALTFNNGTPLTAGFYEGMNYVVLNHSAVTEDFRLNITDGTIPIFTNLLIEPKTTSTIVLVIKDGSTYNYTKI